MPRGRFASNFRIATQLLRGLHRRRAGPMEAIPAGVPPGQLSRSKFRDIGAEVGIKAASIYHHFHSKADLGAAVAKRYWEDTAANLEALSAASSDPKKALKAYPGLFVDHSRRIIGCASAASWRPSMTIYRTR